MLTQFEVHLLEATGLNMTYDNTVPPFDGLSGKPQSFI